MARTVEFDRDTVLENAMNTFWQKGYSMTSIPNLVEATKLNPGSIYAAFQSKEGLFLETLEFYGSKSVEKLRQLLQSSTSPVEGIESFLKSLIKPAECEDNRGCLVVNTLLEMSSHNSKIQALAKKQLDAVENEILITLQKAQAQNELSSSADPETLAQYLMVNVWGLRVLAKTNPDQTQANAIVDQIVITLHAKH